MVAVRTADVVGGRRVGVAPFEHNLPIGGGELMVRARRRRLLRVALEPLLLLRIEDPGVVREIVQMVSAKDHEELRLRIPDDRRKRPRRRFGIERLGFLLQPDLLFVGRADLLGGLPLMAFEIDGPHPRQFVFDGLPLLPDLIPLGLARVLRTELLVDRLPGAVHLDPRVRVAVIGLLVLAAERERRAVGDLERRAPDDLLLEVRGRKPVRLLLGLGQEREDKNRVSHFPSFTQVSLNATQLIRVPKA